MKKKIALIFLSLLIAFNTITYQPKKVDAFWFIPALTNPAVWAAIGQAVVNTVAIVGGVVGSIKIQEEINNYLNDNQTAVENIANDITISSHPSSSDVVQLQFGENALREINLASKSISETLINDLSTRELTDGIAFSDISYVQRFNYTNIRDLHLNTGYQFKIIYTDGRVVTPTSIRFDRNTYGDLFIRDFNTASARFLSRDAVDAELANIDTFLNDWDTLHDYIINFPANVLKPDLVDINTIRNTIQSIEVEEKVDVSALLIQQKVIHEKEFETVFPSISADMPLNIPVPRGTTKEAENDIPKGVTVVYNPTLDKWTLPDGSVFEGNPDNISIPVSDYVPNVLTGENGEIITRDGVPVTGINTGEGTMIDTLTGEGITTNNPDVPANPTGPGDLPSTSSINWQKLLGAFTGLSRVFPLSIPWDIGRAVDALFGGVMHNTGPPVFKFEIPFQGKTNTFNITIPQFIHDLMPFARVVMVASFDIALIYALYRWFGVLLNMLDWLGNGLASLLNWFIDLIYEIVTFIIDALPQTPFEWTPLDWGVFGQAVGYFLPVGTMVSHLTVILGAISIWYMYRWVLRLLKAIQ